MLTKRRYVTYEHIPAATPRGVHQQPKSSHRVVGYLLNTQQRD